MSTAPLPQPPSRSRYSLGSLPNMMRSLLVIAALVAIVIVIVPRSEQIRQPAVDAAAKAAWTAKESGWPIESPVGLAPGWQATTATYAPATDSVVTYTAVYQSPDGQFITLREAKGPTQNWLDETLDGAESEGLMPIGSRTWESWHQSEKKRYALVQRSALTLVVTGSGSAQDVAEFASLLARVTPAS